MPPGSSAGFGVLGCGFGVVGLGFGVKGQGFWRSGLSVQGLIPGVWFGAPGSGC